MGWTGAALVIVSVIGVVSALALSPGGEGNLNRQLLHAAYNGLLVCPHCQTKGHVRTKSIQVKQGISGTKATAAILTGGISLLVVGLSRKHDATQASCARCRSVWTF